jgi:hypothetical protein
MDHSLRIRIGWHISKTKAGTSNRLGVGLVVRWFQVRLEIPFMFTALSLNQFVMLINLGRKILMNFS